MARERGRGDEKDMGTRNSLTVWKSKSLFLGWSQWTKQWLVWIKNIKNQKVKVPTNKLFHLGHSVKYE
jgi:hypothetical protein